MDSLAAPNSMTIKPKRVTDICTVFFVFHYSTAMSVGEVAEIGTSEIDFINNRNFKFLLKKTSEETVTIVCERHVKDETLKADSDVEGDALEADSGCFLRLYISVFGVKEKPKAAVLLSTDRSTSVEFKEESFSNPMVHVDYTYTLKCAVRSIETTVLSNEFGKKQKLQWEEFVLKACKSQRQRKDMDYVLDRPKQVEALTGRRIKSCLDWKFDIFRRACYYSNKLVQYFKAKDNLKPAPTDINVGLILGYLYDERKTEIPFDKCLYLYRQAVYYGLIFVKELCTAYIIENMNDGSVTYVLFAADLSEDARIFTAAWNFCKKNKLQIFRSREWKLTASLHKEYVRSIVHGFLLRCLTDDQGFPPALEDETGHP